MAKNKRINDGDGLVSGAGTLGEATAGGIGQFDDATLELKPRPDYLATLAKFLDNGAIKVISGMRRCGKSSLLIMLARYLREKGVPQSNIVMANFESSEFFDVTDYRSLTAWLHKRMKDPGHYYVLLDEVQLVDHWERAINALRVDADADVYLTGSNAYLLSSQLATLLSGRYEEINVYPLSFKEFMRYAGLSDSRLGLERYLRFGGLPPVVDQGDDRQLAETMLSGIYNTVVVKDVVQHVQIRNMAIFGDVARFLADTTGSSVAVTNIEHRLASAHRKTAGGTIERYVQGLVDAFLFSRARRYDLKGGTWLQGGEKYYPADSGIRDMLLDFPTGDLGFALENAVYNELRVRGFDVRIGKLGAIEVDFIATKGETKLALQVTATMLEDKTRQRELAPLRQLMPQAVNEGLRRMVLTYDTVGLGVVDGIKIVNAVDWLLE
ncbi:ATP-binding protein [Bifidobacterium sp. ESL0728]|uniref:ATP-binding protein n=1 Tax=Bifidobacterium sp. ESL0728 TaxID=2983220 RepID=UPI0023F722D4|nr:ATP-binding protein [Bifidobacterium sp. ESL0728]WEV59135.1 ATP-binding protein [Bifidobacterium sp. ESL0728]